MENLNCSCPECGKKFHACSACGLNYMYEYEYCSDTCYKKTFKYEEKKNKLINLMKLSKKDIFKLDDLTYYIQEELDALSLFFTDEDIRKVWYDA